MTDTELQSQLLLFALRQVTESAAQAAAEWINCGDAHQINSAAVNAMREKFSLLPIQGHIIVGDGSDTGGERAAFAPNEHVGTTGSKLEFDIAVDPVEGTSYLTKGMTNAMAVMALAPKDTMFKPGPAFYMEKFAGPPAVKGKIDPEAPLEDKLKLIARETGKSVSDLIVYILEKPRHRALVEGVQKAGAHVAHYPAGDIAGAIMAAIPDSGIDALVGTGGSPEGIISACAIRAIGGEFLCRLNPQLPSEHIAVRDAGMNTDNWMGLNDLVCSDRVYFSGTGITTGLLFDGIECTQHYVRTESMLISGETGERHNLTTYHSRPGND